MRLIACALLAVGLLAQTPVPSPFIGGVSSGGGVTSVIMAGTANQIAVAGTCTITTTGTCTFSLPSAVTFPGSATVTSTLTVGTSLSWDGSAGVETGADISTPANPAASHTKLYPKGGKFCSLSPAGVENCLGAGGSSPGTPDGSLQYRVDGTTFGGITYAGTDGDYIQVSIVSQPEDNLSPALAGAGAGNVDNGAHCYAYSFTVADNLSDTTASHGSSTSYATYSGAASVTVVDNSVDGKVLVSGMDVSPDPRVISRTIYRTKAGASCSDTNMFVWGIIANNAATSFTDNVADSDLTDQWPAFNLSSMTGLIKMHSSDGVTGWQMVGDAGISINNTQFNGRLSSFGEGSWAGIVVVDPRGGYVTAAKFPNDNTLFLNGAGGFTNSTTGLTQTLVVKGSDGNNCDVTLVRGVTTATTCP